MIRHFYDKTWSVRFTTLNQIAFNSTGGDSSNRGCFGRKTNLFRESGDFAGNRETWEVFREKWDIFGILSKDLILHVIIQYICTVICTLCMCCILCIFDTWKQLNSPWYEKTNQQHFSGKMRYFRDIEQRFDITCYHTIYMHRDMHPVYVLYFSNVSN